MYNNSHESTEDSNTKASTKHSNSDNLAKQSDLLDWTKHNNSHDWINQHMLSAKSRLKSYFPQRNTEGELGEGKKHEAV